MQRIEATHAAVQSIEQGKSIVNVDDGDSVLDFTYAYLQAHVLPPSDKEVRNITAALAQYKGPPLVTSNALEGFLAGLGASLQWLGRDIAL